MKPWMLAILAGAREPITKTYKENTRVVIPVNVARLESVIGAGAPGAPGTTIPAQEVSFVAADVQVTNIVGRGPYAPRTWESIRSEVENIANQVRASPAVGSSNSGCVNYSGYLGDNTAFYNYLSRSWSGATNISTSFAGWGTGVINSRGLAFVSYVRPASTTGPTTGAAATGFGQTFAGGTGGAATPREVKGVAVTPGAPYDLVIPVDGSITITYYQ